MSEPENLTLKLLRDIREDMVTKKDLAEVRNELKNDVSGVKGGLDDLRSDLNSLRADVASDLILMENRLSERISHVNSAVIQYHSTTVGHGVLIGELDERLRRVEQHLKLESH